jgi:acetylglutamate kinase
MNNKRPMVLKIGGGEVDSPAFLARLTGLIAGMKSHLVIVHGAGKEIGRLLEALGQPVRFHEGLRITDDKAIEVVEMVLSGLVNKRIVGALQQAGLKALGLSGRDLGLIRARKLESPVDLGHVGDPYKINALLLYKMLDYGWIPVISPVSQDEKGTVYNINADHVAQGVALGLKAAELVFLSNVPCVLEGDHEIGTLTAPDAERLIQNGVISGGMLPKVRSSLAAIEGGVQKVLITDIDGLEKYLGGRVVATMITRA